VAFEINLLGPLEVLVDGERVVFARRRERWLLVLLAVRAPEVIPLEQLIADLWDGDPPDGAPTTLRTYVSALRRALRPYGRDGVIITSRGGYALADAETVDVRRFDALNATARDHASAGNRAAEATTLAQALALWRGGPSLDLPTDDSAIGQVAQELAARRLDALARWADAELACGRGADAAGLLASVCEADPGRQDLWALRMRSLARAGRHADALQTYGRLYRRLRDELGIRPSAQLRELELAILRQDPDLDPPSAVVARSSGEAGVPAALRAPLDGEFVGRETELETLDAAAALARSGAGHLVVVLGEGGAGKTRLLGHWAQQAATSWQILYGRCDRDDASPFAPFVEALGARLDVRAVGVANGDLGGARSRLFAAITDHVLDAASARPIAFVIDDLHWADDSTMELLRYLARRAGQTPVLILLSCRSNEAPAQLTALAQDPGYGIVDLPGLSAAEVATLVASSPLARHPGLAADVYDLSAGNPLLVRQVLAQLEVGGADERQATRGLAAVIDRRLNTLGDTTLRVLSVAALLGETFDLVELETAVDRAESDPEHVLGAVEAAQRARLVVAVDDGERWRFTHDLIREGILRRLSGPRRRRLHGQIADALERVHADAPTDAALFALAAQTAAAARPGQLQRAARYAALAGRRALASLAFEQAATIAQRGLDCLSLGPDEPSPERCRLLLLLAEARLLLRDIDGCQALSLRAGEDARALGLTHELAQAAITGTYLSQTGQPRPELQRLAEDALAANQAEPALASQVLAGLADYASSADLDSDAASRLAEDAIKLAHTADDPTALARALFIAGDVLEQTPQLVRRRALADELAALAADTGDARAAVNAAHLHGLVDLQAGDLAAFDRSRSRIETLRGELDYWYTDLYLLLWRGMRALLDGRLDEVEPSAEAMLAHATHEPNVVNLYMGQLFCLRWEQGRLPELRDALIATVAANQRLTVFRCALAMAQTQAGDHAAAREILTELRADDFASVHRDETYTISLGALAETAAAVGDVASSRQLIRLLEPYSGLILIGTRGLACLSTTDRLLGRLHATCGETDRARLLLGHAIGLGEGIGSPTLRARAAHDLDTLNSTTG
jgi:DNA-binding SARP family transcriptional activator